MKLNIDLLNSTSGWSGSTGVVFTENEFEQYIANSNTKSLQIKFPGDAALEEAEKTLGAAVDVTDYDELSFHIISFRKSYTDYLSKTTMFYKLDIGSGVEYLIPTFPGFNDVTISLSGITSISSIKITSLHTDEDFIIISNMIAILDELPLDIFQGVKEGLEAEINTQGFIQIGSVTTVAGNKFIIVENADYTEKDIAIKIDDTVNDELHHVSDYDDDKLYFSTILDGQKTLNAYTAAPVYLYVPVRFGNMFEAVIPSVTLWEGAHEQAHLRAKQGEVIDTITTTNVAIRKEGQFIDFDIFIDCEGWQQQVLKRIAQAVRKWIGKQVVYINGRKHTFTGMETPSVNIQVHEPIETVPKIQYTITIQVKEELWTRSTTPREGTTTIEMQQALAGS
jgi:hypothetical protein